MIITIHQPAYLPWLGYFDKLKKSDVFVFLDSVQYEKNSFINRNKIKTPQGEQWLTIPVLIKGHTGSTLQNTEIDWKQNWQKKHLASIFQNYSKAPYFDSLFDELTKLYEIKFPLLADLCYEQLLFWLEKLKISTKIIRSRDLAVSGIKSDLILNICKHFKANEYISGALGQDYLDVEIFKANNIKIHFQEFVHPVYNQLHGAFIPSLSILDYCMNNGFELNK